MAGYYRLGSHDARELARMIEGICTDRTRAGRAFMALFCWSQMYAKGEPCPHFRCGIRTIAKECDTTNKAAQKFIERAERDGHIVRLGDATDRKGTYTKRTFSWVAEEAADDAGMDLDEWLTEVGGVPQKGYRGVPQVGYRGVPQLSGERVQGCTPNAERKGTHQSTEYSERGAARPVSEDVTRAPRVVDGMRVPSLPEGWA